MTRCALGDDFRFSFRLIDRKTLQGIDTTGWQVAATVSHRETGAVLAGWTSAGGQFTVAAGGRFTIAVPKAAMTAPLVAGTHLIVCRRIDGGRSEVFLRRLLKVEKADP